MNNVLRFGMTVIMVLLVTAGSTLAAFGYANGSYLDENVWHVFDPMDDIPTIPPTWAATEILEQVSTFAELQAAVNSAVHGVERRIEIFSDFHFEETIDIQWDRIITLYTNGGIRQLIAPVDARHFAVQGTLNLQGGVSLVGNGGNGGGVFNNGTFNMSGNSAIMGNVNYSDHWFIAGGGVQNSGIFTMVDNAAVSNNSVISSGSAAVYGGGINMGHGTLIMTDNAVVEGNIAKSDTGPAYGGGVNFGHGSITMSGNAQIRYNTAFTRTSAVYGGGIYQHGGIVTMADNAALIGNIAHSVTGWTAVGGGIHSGYNSIFNMSGNASILNNEANSGGGVWMSYMDSVMTMDGNATIDGNTARDSGGGVHLVFDSTLQMNGGSISNNTARYGGGVAASSWSFVNIESGFVIGNTAHQNGGGIMATLPNLTVGANAVFWDNSAATGYPYRRPADDAIYEQNIRGTSWTSPFVQGYNNFDIVYQNAVYVTFDGNGGSPWWDSHRLAFGTSFGWDMPTDPVRDNYVFWHWNTQRDGTGYAFDCTTPVMANMTVFAQWLPIELPVFFTVIYDGNGHDSGNVPIDHNVYSFGEIAIVMDSNDLYRSGYEFAGWNTHPDGNGTTFAVGDMLIITYDTILFAVWEPVELPTIVAVIFDGNGGIVLPENQTRQLVIGNSLGENMPTDNPVRDGYSFKGWNTAQNGTGFLFTDAAVVNADITVFAIWEDVQEPTIVTVTFDGNGGVVLTENQTRQVVVGDSLDNDMPTDVPVRDGYNFNGWNTTQDGTGDSFTETTVVNADITVFATWESIQEPEPTIVTVTFNGNSGIVLPVNQTRQVAVGDSLGNDMPTDEPVKDGYNFDGWNTAQDSTGDSFTGTTVVNVNMTVYAQWVQIQTPPVEQPGRLNITNIAEGSRDRLPGGVFGIYHAMSGEQVAEIQANQIGEAFAMLDAGDYFLRQSVAPGGYQLNLDRHNFSIRANEITEVVVINRLIPTETPPPTAQPGRLLVTVVSENSGERLAGVRFNVYHAQTNVVVATLVTDRFGEAFVELPVGDYFLRQTGVPNGYILNMDRIRFSIGENILTEVTVRLRQLPTTPEPETTPPTTPRPQPTPPTQPPTPSPNLTPPTPTPPPNQTPAPSPTPPTPPAGNNNATSSTEDQSTEGTLQIVARAGQSGNLLPGAVFAVYRVSDGVRITELTTDTDGRVTHSLPSGEYYLRQLRATFGYLPEAARIFFTVEDGQTVVVEVTNQHDKNISSANHGNITLPQTGELLPIMNYVLGGVLLFVAVLCGVGLFKQRKPKRNNNSGTKSHA